MATAIAAMLVVCLLALAGCGPAFDADGRAKIEALSENTVEDVQSHIVRAEWQEHIDVFNAAAQDGQITPEEANSVYDGIVFIGDSITESISGYGYLGTDKVVATIGVSLQSAGPMVEQAAQLYPTHVILAFGENDLDAYNADPGPYVKDLETVVGQVRSAMPSARIYVAAIMKPADKAIADDPNMAGWEAFNAAARAYVESTDDVTYIDTVPVSVAHMDMHEPDGLHFTSAFYAFYLAEVGKVVFS